jgi:hypothetical protein
MKAPAWDSQANLYLYGREPVHTGTLGSCVTYWRDNLSAFGQTLSAISVTETAMTKSWLEPEDIIELANGHR